MGQRVIEFPAALVITWTGDENPLAAQTLLDAAANAGHIRIGEVAIDMGDDVLQAALQAWVGKSGASFHVEVRGPLGGSDSGKVDKATVAGMTTRADNGHLLFENFLDWQALKDLMRALGVQNASQTASALNKVHRSSLRESSKLWPTSEAFDLTAFVELAESGDEAAEFWAACISPDVSGVGPHKVELMIQLARKLRAEGVV